MSAPPKSDRVQIELKLAEALLLFEGLAKLEDKKLLDMAVSDEERTAFWRLEAALERLLPLFSPDYAALIEAAKREINGQ